MKTAMKLLGFLTPLAMLLTSPAAAVTTPTFVRQWGDMGTGPGQFRGPRGVAVDADGFVYVADRYNSRIQKFDSNGGFVTQWYVRAPFAVAAAPNGNIYVTQQLDDVATYYSPTGTLLGTIGSPGNSPGQFNTPLGIAIDEDGSVYVADLQHDWVQKFTASGTFLLKWGSIGTADGEFSDVFGIASDRSGHIYVADLTRIQKFTTTGSRLGGWSTGGRVRFIATDSNGNIYATDETHDNVKIFDPTGSLLLTFGQCCSGRGEFQSPAGLALDSNGDLFIADSYYGDLGGNNRIQKFETVSTAAKTQTWGAIKSTYAPH